MTTLAVLPHRIVEKGVKAMRGLQSLELSECSVRGESLKPLVRAIRRHRALVKVCGGRTRRHTPHSFKDHVTPHPGAYVIWCLRMLADQDCAVRHPQEVQVEGAAQGRGVMRVDMRGAHLAY